MYFYTEHLTHKQKSIMGKYNKCEGKWNKLTAWYFSCSARLWFDKIQQLSANIVNNRSLSIDCGDVVGSNS